MPCLGTGQPASSNTFPAGQALPLYAYPYSSTASLSPDTHHVPPRRYHHQGKLARERRRLTRQVANIIVFAVSLGSNVYSVAGPDDIYGHQKITYITPSSYVSV